MKIKYTLFLTFAFLLLTFSAAHAVNFSSTGNPDDTLSGTVITAFATAETLNYTDINDNAKPQVTPVGNIAVTVLPEYGFSIGAARAVNVSGKNSNYGYINQTRYIYVGITNEGNVSDTYTITAEYKSTPVVGSGTWAVTYWRDNAPYGTAEGSDVLIGTLTPGTTTSETQSVAEDAAYFCYMKVVYPNNTANPDDLITTGCTIKTSSTPVGQYTGANGLTYGGTSEYGTGQNFTWKVAKPVMVINARKSYVDAPLFPYGGIASDAVPGSIISYVVTYSNTGNCSAESVVFVDKLPGLPYTNTHLAHINKGLGNSTQNTDHVVLTDNNSNPGILWTVWYTNSDPPTSKAYGNYTNWTMIGTLDATGTVFPTVSSATYSVIDSNPETNAKWIKFEKAKVPETELSKMLTWGVTIR